MVDYNKVLVWDVHFFDQSLDNSAVSLNMNAIECVDGFFRITPILTFGLLFLFPLFYLLLLKVEGSINWPSLIWPCRFLIYS